MTHYTKTQPGYQSLIPSYLKLPEPVRHYEIPTNSDDYTNLAGSEKSMDGLNPNKLESFIQNTQPKYQNIAESIMSDKLLLQSANIELLKQLINKRTKIKQDNIMNIDHRIQQCRIYLVELEDWSVFSNSLVESKRSNLGSSISRMESEKCQESSRCWNDQVRLYQELLKTMGEYRAVHRRNSLLSGNKNYGHQ
jgi:hypothetical protein